MNDTRDLADRLRTYISQIAPHQKERGGGNLLREALAEIEKLRGIIERDKAELKEALRQGGEF